jgi:hypothetical protein
MHERTDELEAERGHDEGGEKDEKSVRQLE